MTEAGTHSSQESALLELKSACSFESHRKSRHRMRDRNPKGNPERPRESKPSGLAQRVVLQITELGPHPAHRAARVQDKEVQCNMTCAEGSSWRPLVMAKAGKKPLILPPSSEVTGTWPIWKDMTLLQTHSPVGGT